MPTSKVSKLLIQNAKMPSYPLGWVFCEDGKIAALGTDAPLNFGADCVVIDAPGLTVLPGFIDVHVHGALGCDTMDASADSLQKMAQFYAQHGVTSFLATTWTDSQERILAALQAIRQNLGPHEKGATLIGAHLEGPYLNPSKCGAQNLSYIRRALPTETYEFLATEVIRLLALAPEYPENHWLIMECVQRGITVSVAHTAATYADVLHAAKLGLSHSTHTYNAMTGLHHREPGVVGAVMTIPEIYCELIADNIHVHPAAMQILYTAKGPDHLLLVSDAVRAAGMPDGEYQLDERPIVVKDGAVQLPDGTLAGSTLTMDRALYNFMTATGLPLELIWQISSLNAARALHMDDRKGSLEIGKDADLVIVDDQINVYYTIALGQVVYGISIPQP